MKDLYRKLGIDPNASAGEIAAALELNPDMSHCSAILTDQEKRAAYNQAHATLNAIGILRHRLGLDSDESWFLENCPHFAPRLQMRKKADTRETTAPGSLPEGIQQVPEQAGPEPDQPVKSSHTILIVVVVVLAFLAILAYTFL